MAATFPIAMPRFGATGQEFEIQRVDYSSPDAGGRLGGVQAGFPRWMATWTLGTMSADASDALRAFWAMMRGAQRRFYGFDLARPFPRLYPDGFAGLDRAGGGAFDGAAASWSETIDGADNSLVTLTNLPAGLGLSLGDYIGFKWDAAGDAAGSYRRRALVRVVEAGIAGLSGSVTVTAEPPIPLVVPVGAVAHLDQPCCVMGFPDSQSKLGPIGRLGKIGSGTLVALQDIRA